MAERPITEKELKTGDITLYSRVNGERRDIDLKTLMSCFTIVRGADAYTPKPDVDYLSIDKARADINKNLVVLRTEMDEYLAERFSKFRQPVDGKTPEPDKDYLSLEAGNAALAEVKAKAERAVAGLESSLRKGLAEALQAMRATIVEEIDKLRGEVQYFKDSFRQPEDGKTPVAGVDYPDEEQIRAMIPPPVPGKTPVPDKDYLSVERSLETVEKAVDELGGRLHNDMAAWFEMLPKALPRDVAERQLREMFERMVEPPVYRAPDQGVVTIENGAVTRIDGDCFNQRPGFIMPKEPGWYFHDGKLQFIDKGERFPIAGNVSLIRL